MKNCLIVLSFLMLSALTACEHTVQGFGQDMVQTGKAIQKTANN